MKKLLAAATLVALGAGTIGVGALSNVNLKGSDTLKDVTLDILGVCPAATGLVYLGTGSGNGEGLLRDTGVPGGVNDGVGKSNGCTLPNCQTVAPMSRFLQSGATCAFPKAYTGSTAPDLRSAALAEGISFALDGIVVVGSAVHAAAPDTTDNCNDDAALPGADPIDDDKTTGPSAGMAYDKTITVQDVNTTPGIQCGLKTDGTSECSGAGGDQYTIGQGSGSNGWKDVLRVVYTGATMDTTNAGSPALPVTNCDSDLRATIVNNWGNLFQNNCTGATCTELKHAFRRDDESGTTDTFLALIGAPTLNVAGGLSAFCNNSASNQSTFGTLGAVAHSLDTSTNRACTVDADCGATCGLSCVAGFCTGTNEFPGGGMPARPAIGGAVVAGYSVAYNPDFQDNDPIRRGCTGTYDSKTDGSEPNAGPAEQVCRARRARLGTGFAPAGTLGLVLSINPPPTTPATIAQAYPTKPCKFGVFSQIGPAPTTGSVAPQDPEYPAATRAIIKVDRCPNGDIPSFLTPSAGKCFVPLAADGDPACINGRNNLPAATVDGAAQCTTGGIDTTDRIDPVKGTFTGGGGGDGRVYNLHLYFLDTADGKIKYRTIVRNGAAVNITSAFYRIHTSRTLTGTGTGGCQESTATKQIGCLVQASPCSIGYAGGEAKDTLPIGTAVGFKINALDPSKSGIRKLINTGTPYPLSRQLWINSMAGFENVTGQELELAKCFAGAVTAAPFATGLEHLEDIITQRGFTTRGDGADPKRNPGCVDYPQQLATNAAPFNGCNQPLIATTPATCTATTDCPLGYTCNASSQCVAVDNACLNNPAGIPTN